MTAVAIQPGKSGLSQWALGLLPTPHLLDAAWWFDRETVESFRVEVEALPINATVGFLGTPSLFVDASERGEERTCVLVDRDDAIRDRLPERVRSHLEVCDLLKGVPHLRGADLVLADPPWYVDETMAFLAAGQATSRVRAEVQICLPPLATRPTIEQERASLFDWAAAGGLRRSGALWLRFFFASPAC